MKTKLSDAGMEDRWLSVDEIAAYLGVKRDTVYNWIAGKGMPAHRIGRLWKFRRAEVDEWVRSDVEVRSCRSTPNSNETSLPAENEIIRILRIHAADMRKRYSLKRMGLFGSHVHGMPDDQSDIDLIVEFENPTFDNYMELKFFLEDLFDRPVDLVMADSIKPRLRPVIAADVVYA